MDKTIEISKELWLVIERETFVGDGLFHLSDNTGRDVLIGVDEIPQLIEALQKVQERVIHA
jgi:glyoxylase-like metal-dependent hydrolase (beta-lactamase superfamily II)